MPSNSDSTQDQSHSADELASLAGLPRRTIRYYIQLGLVDRPIGETRGARYGWQHLSRLLRIRELTEQGHSLDQIGRMLSGPESAPAVGPAAGSISIQSQVHLAPGLALTIDPALAHLSPEQLRALARDVLGAYQRHSQSTEETTHESHTGRNTESRPKEEKDPRNER
jgi:DNA-binding transcriptional MerR regulator